MNINELYEKYVYLKKQNLSFEDLEYSLYQFLINFQETTKDNFTSYDIEKKVNPLDYESFSSIFETRKKMEFKDDEKFVIIRNLNKTYIDSNYMKFYLSIPDNLKEQFLIEYGKFIKDNEIRGQYKIRRNCQSNDLLTVRVYDPKHYKIVFEFLKKYKNEDMKQHIFMPTIDGIGVSIDDNRSYNKYIIDGLMNYFEICKDKNEINNINFIKYMTSYDGINAMNNENKNSSIVYNLNLINSQNKNLSFDEVLNVITKSQEEIKQYPASQKDVNRFNNLINNILNEITEKKDITAVLKRFELNLQPYGIDRSSNINIIKAIEYHLTQNNIHINNSNGLDYLKEQLIIFNNNLNTICNDIELEFQNNGIEGVKNILNEIERIENNPNESKKLNIQETFIPCCNYDSLHPKEIFYTRININRIYKKMFANNDLKPDHFCNNPRDEILNFYSRKIK